VLSVRPRLGGATAEQTKVKRIGHLFL